MIVLKIKTCLNCQYFHCCEIVGADPHGYCNSSSDILGICNLWDAERLTTEGCGSWVPCPT